MRVMVAADIHGSAGFCKKMLQLYKKEECDKLLLLGDLLYHGPRNDLPEEYRPKEVIAMLNQMRDEILCVRGNCDTEVDQMVLDFPILADYCYLCLGKQCFFVTHGHKYHKQQMPPLKLGEILLHGHTHVPAYEMIGQNLYLNPGSVSIPKEGSRHGVMVLDETRAHWIDLDGNHIREEIFCTE